jgi:nucleoside-diphosphate-sugar epimerase
MSTVFVTGASGFIGTLLVGELLRQGHVVHALIRRGRINPPAGFSAGELPDFNQPNLRLFAGDITDSESLRRGMADCSHVYHLAGYAKNWAPSYEPYLQNNVHGLYNVCSVARELGVQKIVWTSTMLTFGATARGEIGDESKRRDHRPMFTAYERSKLAAEAEAGKFVTDGLPLVIVNPGRVFGPGHLTEGNSLARVIDLYDRGKMPFLLGGGRHIGNWVLVDDVVQGLIAAMERGRSGEKYLLGGENLSLKQFLQLIDEVSDKRHFQITIRRPASMTYAWLQKQRASWLGIYPQITPDWVRVFLTDWAYSSTKAQRELGYQITPVEAAVKRTYQWLLRVRTADGKLN